MGLHPLKREVLGKDHGIHICRTIFGLHGFLYSPFAMGKGGVNVSTTEGPVVVSRNLLPAVSWGERRAPPDKEDQPQLPISWIKCCSYRTMPEGNDYCMAQKSEMGLHKCICFEMGLWKALGQEVDPALQTQKTLPIILENNSLYTMTTSFVYHEAEIGPRILNMISYTSQRLCLFVFCISNRI